MDGQLAVKDTRCCVQCQAEPEFQSQQSFRCKNTFSARFKSSLFVVCARLMLVY